MRIAPKPNVIIFFLALFYLVGIIGFAIPLTRPIFITLIPFALVMSVFLLMVYHKPAAIKNYLFLLLIAFSGFFVEVVGVKTGWLFGNYGYGYALGPKWMEVPILIGINWLLLTYCIAILLVKYLRKTLIQVLVGALIVTLFDYIMEPVAVFTGMWYWHDGIIPLQNYIMWFLTASIFIYGLVTQTKNNKNPLAAWIFLYQLIFFAALHVIIKLL